MSYIDFSINIDGPDVLAKKLSKILPKNPKKSKLTHNLLEQSEKRKTDILFSLCSGAYDSDRADLARYLISIGAKPYTSKQNCLVWAARTSKPKVMRECILAGVDQSLNNYEALRWAAASTHERAFDCVSCLLDFDSKGALVQDFCALNWAIRAGNEKVAVIIASHIPESQMSQVASLFARLKFKPFGALKSDYQAHTKTASCEQAVDVVAQKTSLSFLIENCQEQVEKAKFKL